MEEEIEVEERVYVAVPERLKEGKSVLLWALQNVSNDAKVFLTHVHVPPQMIPLPLGGKVHASRLSPAEVRAYRLLEKQKMAKNLNEYLTVCKKLKITVEPRVIEKDDIVQGLIELIEQEGVTKLVMGAAADKHHSRKMRAPKSKTAISVMQNARPSCKIWFVCKGYLIYTREAAEAPEPSLGPSSTRNLSEQSRFFSFPSRHTEMINSNPNPGQDITMQRMRSEVIYSPGFAEQSPHRPPQATAASSLSTQRGSSGPSKRDVESSAAVSVEASSENLYSKVVEERKEIEETLAREKQEIELLKSQSEEISEQVQKVDLALGRRFPNYDQLQLERHASVKEAQELHNKREQMSDLGILMALGSEFSLLELKQATQDFSNSLKIGAGGFGAVYKGFLRNTLVAIKKLHPRNLQDLSEFRQEVSVLSRMRHPNLVTLVGACPEAWALVYEFLPNGSLEDHLACANNGPPLSWQARTRIIGEICSALIFLHANKPHPMAHGGLKPANILLDANFVSKLGDFGICHLLNQSDTADITTTLRTTNTRGTFPYMDPEIFSTGELTVQSDVYSFGIILLRLLTGKPASNIADEVEDALEEDKLDSIIDPSAGGWPLVQAKKLAELGVRCAERRRKHRPDLEGEVWRVIEPMMKVAAFSRSVSDDDCVPSSFVCPISQEIMKDPQMAADGFTYEAGAMKDWLDRHDTSPMTNLKLQHRELIPNHTLRSAILEWQEQQQQH